MLRRRVSAVSKHECPSPSFETRVKDALLRMRSACVAARLLRRLDRPGHTYTELQRFFSRCHWRGFGGASGHSAKHDRRGCATLGDAERCAKCDAGGLGIDFGLAAGIGDGFFASLVEKFRGL